MGDHIEKGTLFTWYKQWCDENKHYILPAAKFSTAVYKQFHKETPKNAHLNNGKRIWRNLKYVHFKGMLQEDVGYSE